MDTILIVDDNQTLRKFLARILLTRGYKLAEAVDGQEALDTCFEILPDLILLDVEMPVYDGYQVCKILKSDRRTMDIPIIILSAKTGSANKIKGLEMGAADYITKPFDGGEVLARVKSQLHIRHLTQSLMDANRQLMERQSALDADLKAAGLIQKSLIPVSPPRVKGFEFAWRFAPCQQVGGDIFNIHRLDEAHVCMYVVDVSGHGVTSAMITVSVSQQLLPTTGSIMKRKTEYPPHYEIVPPTDVLNLLDREYPVDRFDRYFTISYLIVNIHTGDIRYSSAGHPPPAIVRSDDRVELLEAGGTVIGMGDRVPFKEGRTAIRPGDRLFLYTDGIVEYTDSAGELFGEERFFRQLVRGRKTPLDTACENLITSLNTHGGEGNFQDDVTLLALECKGLSP